MLRGHVDALERGEGTRNKRIQRPIAVEGENGQLRHALLLMGELHLVGDVELVPERHSATSHEYERYLGVRLIARQLLLPEHRTPRC